MKHWSLILLIFSLALPSFAGQESIQNGVLKIENSAHPQGHEIRQLERLWSIGGEDEDYIFRSISSVVLGHDGNIYILDGRSAIIYVNSLSDGSAVREMSIDGDGPGELRFAKDMFSMNDNSIGLLRSHPGKLVCIDYNGIPQESFYVRGNSNFNAGFGAWQNGVLVLSGADENIRNGQMFLARFDNYGEMYRYESYQVKSSAFRMELSEEEDYFFYYKPWAIDQDGLAYFAPYWSLSNQGYYQINIYDQQGKKMRIITREYEAYKRSGKDKKNVALQKYCGEEGLRELENTGIEFIPEDYEPDILRIYAHPDGNIWVATSRGVRDQAQGIMISYDVFSPTGHFIKQVALAVDGDGQKDMVYFLNSDTVVIVKGQSDIQFGCPYSSETEDILELICYRLR